MAVRDHQLSQPADQAAPVLVVMVVIVVVRVVVVVMVAGVGHACENTFSCTRPRTHLP